MKKGSYQIKDFLPDNNKYQASFGDNLHLFVMNG